MVIVLYLPKLLQFVNWLAHKYVKYIYYHNAIRRLVIVFEADFM